MLTCNLYQDCHFVYSPLFKLAIIYLSLAICSLILSLCRFSSALSFLICSTVSFISLSFWNSFSFCKSFPSFLLSASSCFCFCQEFNGSNVVQKLFNVPLDFRQNYHVQDLMHDVPLKKIKWHAI